MATSPDITKGLAQPIDLTEQETTQLMELSTNDKFLGLAFGVGGVQLRQDPSNDWARAMIAQWRAEEQTPQPDQPEQ